VILSKERLYDLPIEIQYETKESKMLVVVSVPEIDGKKRIALGPCKRKGDLVGNEEEPISYYGHLIHLCDPSTIQSDLRIE
jgi:hypothetical protein